MLNMTATPRPTFLSARAISSALSTNTKDKRYPFPPMASALPSGTCSKESTTPKIYSNSRTGALPTTNSKSPSMEARPPRSPALQHSSPRRRPLDDDTRMNMKLKYDGVVVGGCALIGTLDRHSWPVELTLRGCFESPYLSRSNAVLGGRKQDSLIC